MKLTDLNRDGGIGANSLFLQLGDLNILVDCGLHPKKVGRAAAPDFSFLRGKTLAVAGGTSVAGASAAPSSSGGETMKASASQSTGNVTSLRASGAPSPNLTQGAVALKAEAAAEVAAATAPSERDIVANQRAAAKAKGYEGSACPECHNFTMVRNGTCLKCDTCGSTTGCS